MTLSISQHPTVQHATRQNKINMNLRTTLTVTSVMIPLTPSWQKYRYCIYQIGPEEPVTRRMPNTI